MAAGWHSRTRPAFARPARRRPARWRTLRQVREETVTVTRPPSRWPGAAAHFLSWERGQAERARRGIAAASGSISISYGLADLEDIDAVRAFARDFCATHDRLDVLIQNAGGIHPGFGTDTAGTELTIVWQVVAPFLLTACR
jgi:NAD(P)-dependent dehydrogenase (short-subunit alcohol dehydrogenase family)